MTVFLSWSGPTSQRHAEAWRGWINKVFAGSETFISSKDIRAGDDWRREIARRIRGSKVGIVFVTSKNKSKSWILFEAGALAIAKRRRLLVYLISVSPTSLPDPLSSFQPVRADRDGVKSIFKVLSEELGDPKEKFRPALQLLEERLQKRGAKLHRRRLTRR